MVKAKLLHSRKALLILIAAALILILVAAVLASGAYSRYRSQVILANELKYESRLAAGFTLDNEGESRIELVPGTTMTLDPKLTITGKTAIPAYLYLEVSNDSGFYPIDPERWVKLDGLTGKNGGEIYTYKSGALTGSGKDDEILTVNIFADPSVTLEKTPLTTGGTIRIYGYMIQQTGQSDAAACFEEAISQPGS